MEIKSQLILATFIKEICTRYGYYNLATQCRDIETSILKSNPHFVKIDNNYLLLSTNFSTNIYSIGDYAGGPDKSLKSIFDGDNDISSVKYSEAIGFIESLRYENYYKDSKNILLKEYLDIVKKVRELKLNQILNG